MSRERKTGFFVIRVAAAAAASASAATSGTDLVARETFIEAGAGSEQGPAVVVRKTRAARGETGGRGPVGGRLVPRLLRLPCLTGVKRGAHGRRGRKVRPVGVAPFLGERPSVTLVMGPTVGSRKKKSPRPASTPPASLSRGLTPFSDDEGMEF